MNRDLKRFLGWRRCRIVLLVLALVASGLSAFIDPLLSPLTLSCFADLHVVYTIRKLRRILNSRAWNRIFLSQVCSLGLTLSAVYLTINPLSPESRVYIAGTWLLLFALKRVLMAWGFDGFEYDLRTMFKADEVLLEAVKRSKENR
jgi:predicted PurR-regulated permease PerM